MRKFNYILRGLKVCHESYYDRGWAIRDWKTNVRVRPILKFSTGKSNHINGKRYHKMLLNS